MEETEEGGRRRSNGKRVVVRQSVVDTDGSRQVLRRYHPCYGTGLDLVPRGSDKVGCNMGRRHANYMDVTIGSANRATCLYLPGQV
jgi:hypothetical protein